MTTKLPPAWSYRSNEEAFTAGERHMLERCILAVSVLIAKEPAGGVEDGMFQSLRALESLRAPGQTASDDTKACADMWCKGGWSRAPDGSVVGRCVACKGTGRVSVEPAEPSRGGEPAIVQRLRNWVALDADDRHPSHLMDIGVGEATRLLAFIDRPTPAASVPNEPTLHERVVEAQAALLKADNEIITELEAERDRLKARVEELEERCKTIADENGGPHPVQSAEEALTCIEQEFAKRHRESEALRQELDSKHARLVEVADKLREERVERSDLLERVRGSTRWLRGARRATNRSDFDACIDAAIESLLLHPPQPPEQSPEARAAEEPDEQR